MGPFVTQGDEMDIQRGETGLVQIVAECYIGARADPRFERFRTRSARGDGEAEPVSRREVDHPSDRVRAMRLADIPDIADVNRCRRCQPFARRNRSTEHSGWPHRVLGDPTARLVEVLSLTRTQGQSEIRRMTAKRFQNEPVGRTVASRRPAAAKASGKRSILHSTHRHPDRAARRPIQ